MFLNKIAYKFIVALIVIFHIPITFMPDQFIEFGETVYPIPVLLIIGHTWLWIESRSRYVDIKTSIHLYGIITGVLGFLPGMIFYIIPNIFVIIVGMILIGGFVTEDKSRRKEKEKYLKENDSEYEGGSDIVGKLRGLLKRGDK